MSVMLPLLPSPLTDPFFSPLIFFSLHFLLLSPQFFLLLSVTRSSFNSLGVCIAYPRVFHVLCNLFSASPLMLLFFSFFSLTASVTHSYPSPFLFCSPLSILPHPPSSPLFSPMSHAPSSLPLPCFFLLEFVSLFPTLPHLTCFNLF